MQDPEPKAETPDDSMTKTERDDMADQMEEFEGPERREIRGDDKEPANDSGVGHS